MTRPCPQRHASCSAPDRSPATRLFAVEALNTLLLSVSTLLVTTPGHTRVPEWAQLWGLGVLTTMIGATVHTCRLTLARGLMPSAHETAGPGGTTRRLHVQIRVERRLGRQLLLYPVVLIALLPVPATWVRFWFALSLLSILGAALSIRSLARTYFSRAGIDRCRIPESG